MKKTLTAILMFTVLGFSSCKKDRTCECTITASWTSSNGQVISGFSGVGPTSTSTSTAVYKKIKKSDMKSLCTDKTKINTYPNGSVDITTQTIDYKCIIK